MTIYKIVGIAVMALELVIFFVSIFIKDSKTRKRIKALAFLTTFIREMIKEAEKCAGYSGEEKFKFVQTRAKEYLLAHSSTVSKYVTEADVIALIEEEVQLTNAVNVDKKNKGVA